jgi:hypothetical protein
MLYHAFYKQPFTTVPAAEAQSSCSLVPLRSVLWVPLLPAVALSPATFSTCYSDTVDFLSLHTSWSWTPGISSLLYLLHSAHPMFYKQAFTF